MRAKPRAQAKEGIHQPKDYPAPDPPHGSGSHLKIRQQPIGLVRRDPNHFLDDFIQLCRGKTIEKEIRDHQVVDISSWRPLQNVGLNPLHSA